MSDSDVANFCLIVCDWYHNKPQLFFLNKNYNATTIPSSCSRVQLTPDYNVSS